MSSTAFEEVAEGVYQIGSTNSGPHAVVLAGVHGNESSGIQALRNFLEEGVSINQGTLTCIFGDMHAIEADKRYIDKDLNRCFADGVSLDSPLYEERRAAEIISYLQTADYALDLHSATAPSVPFLFSNERLLHDAVQLGASNIVTGWSNFSVIEGDAEEYVNAHGGKAFTFEAGQHADPQSLRDRRRRDRGLPARVRGREGVRQRQAAVL